MWNDAVTQGRTKQAVVTGSSSGIGQAIAQRLLDDGWAVTGLDCAAPTLAHSAFTSAQLDLADAQQCQAFAASLAEPPHAFVHAAGLLRSAPLGHLQTSAGELMWRVHVQAASELVNVWAPQMAALGRGRIVLLGSRVAAGMAGRSQYAATKAAVIALARSWAAEVAGQGVGINVVSPGATQTAMLSDPERQSSQPRMPPIGRLIEPQEIAALTAFLLSDAAAAITGQDIKICGGASLNV